jgi:hypothetical protein
VAVFDDTCGNLIQLIAEKPGADPRTLTPTRTSCERWPISITAGDPIDG